ncbi:MAG: energy-coupling factor ABC transporter permease [Patescibacteria group bacterium]
MHIPDGFLNAGTSIPLIGVAVTFIAISFKKIRQQFFVREKVNKLATPEGAEFCTSSLNKLSKYGQDKIYKMAIVGSFIFAAQMVNFPIAHGTSGHLLGGVLAAILLGPWAGLLTISIILLVQSMLFADGGLMALGANIVNMGIIGTIGGYYIYKFIKKYLKYNLISVFIAAFCSVILAATACSLELALSGTENLGSSLGSMISIHALIGLSEGIITIMVLYFMKFKNKKE